MGKWPLKRRERGGRELGCVLTILAVYRALYGRLSAAHDQLCTKNARAGTDCADDDVRRPTQTRGRTQVLLESM